MIIREEIIHFPTYSIKFLQESPELCLFFDIETTGLSWKRSHLYLLGAVFYENKTWKKTLWFCEKPSEELDVLKAFAKLLNTRKYLLHYNGTTFDVPYLMHKYSFYQQEQSFEHLDSIDLYHSALSFKKLWRMQQMRQKDLEERMGLVRNDPFSGGELIQFYQEYLQSADKNLLECLFLHNSEDMDGLLLLLQILYLKEIFAGNPEVFTDETSLEQEILSPALQNTESPDLKQHITLTLYFKETLSFSFEIQTNYYTLQIAPKHCRIEIPLVHGTKKYFLPDYKNYYYLKYEDCAIHKSVGAYVDKEYRENAKAHNCYLKKTSDFLPIFELNLAATVYKETHKDKFGWVERNDEFLKSDERMHKYALHLLSCLPTALKV